MNCPAISVIIPVYNQEKYVGKCIRSVLGQSFQDFEVIIVNDGSTDKSLKICQKYTKKDGRISIVSKENAGLALARKDGVLKAAGEYVCFLDSDDYLEPDALGALYGIAKTHDVDLVIGNFYRVADSWGLVKRKCPPPPKGQTDRLIVAPELTTLMLGCKDEFLFVVVWGKLYRRDCIMRANEACSHLLFPSDVASEDDSFNLAITAFLRSAWITDRIVCHYRYGGVTGSNFPAIRKGAYLFDERYKEIVSLECESILPTLLVRYLAHLRWDVVNQIHYKSSTERGIREFILSDWEKRKIVQWARRHSSELPVDMQKDGLVHSVLMGDVNAFLVLVNERERFLRKHHYWKMKLLGYYKNAADAIKIIKD